MTLAVYREEILIIANYSYYFKINISWALTWESILITGNIELNKYVEICFEGTLILLGINW